MGRRSSSQTAQWAHVRPCSVVAVCTLDGGLEKEDKIGESERKQTTREVEAAANETVGCQHTEAGAVPCGSKSQGCFADPLIPVYCLS